MLSDFGSASSLCGLYACGEAIEMGEIQMGSSEMWGYTPYFCFRTRLACTFNTNISPLIAIL